MKPYLDGDYYVINGKRYIRLSRVMELESNPGLRAWRNKLGVEEAEKISKETSDYGTRVHLVTAYSDRKQYKKTEKMIRDDENLLPPLLAWQSYVQEFLVSIIAIEQIVWSDELMVAGTIDRVAIIKGDKKHSILDLKTGSLWESIGTRLGGYKIMWNERMRYWKVERYLAVALPRVSPGEIKVKEYTDENFELRFRNLCKEYHKMYG